MGCVRVSGVLQTDGCTPLYIASENGHVEVVRALVGASASVNQAKVRDDCGGALWLVLRELSECVCSLACACCWWRTFLRPCKFSFVWLVLMGTGSIGLRGAVDACGVVMGLAHCRLQLLPPALVVLDYLCVCVCVWQDGWTPFRIARLRGHADVAAVLTEAGGR